MKKMLFLLTVAALSFANAQAQTTPPANGGNYQGRGMGRGMDRTPAQRADMQTQRLTSQLGLTTEQQPKVREIFLSQANRMETLRGSGDRQAMMQQMQDARTSTDAQLKGVLTPEQYTKYEQLREDRMERAGEMRQERVKEGKTKVKADKDKTKSKDS